MPGSRVPGVVDGKMVPSAVIPPGVEPGGLAARLLLETFFQEARDEGVPGLVTQGRGMSGWDMPGAGSYPAIQLW